jgi:hypothetical protein
MEQIPSVGRIVHYVAYGTPGGEFPAGVCRAAVITEVERDYDDVPDGVVTGRVGVCVVIPSGLFFNREISFDEARAPGTWHWPERV